jgi:hypothetical protein
MIFIVRVELHGATSIAIYDQLHDSMSKAGFSRQILGDDSKYHPLPWAEYCFQGNSTMVTVMNAAKTAAATTGFKYSLLVSEASAVQWWPAI